MSFLVSLIKYLLTPSLVGVAVILGASLFFLSPIPILGIVYLFLIGIGMTSYVYQVVLAASAAKRNFPAPGHQDIQFFDRIEYRAHTIMIGGLYAMAILWIETPALSLVLIIVLSLIYPASVAIMALTNSLFHALNPLRWLRMIKRCGSDYWLLWGFILVIGFVQNTIVSIFGVGLITSVTGAYALIASYAAIGFVIHHRKLLQQEDIPVYQGAAQRIAEQATNQASNAVFDNIYRALSTDQIASATAQINRYLNGETDQTADSRALFAKLLEWDINKLLHSTIAPFAVAVILKNLCDHQKAPQAIGILEDYWSTNPDFVPAKLLQPTLIETAESLGRYKTVDQLRYN